MVAVHLTASRFFGGPERQILGLALTLPRDYRTVVASFSEDGNCRPFLADVRRHGLEGVELKHDTPRFFSACSELEALLRCVDARCLFCHAYKSNLLGLWAARRVGIPAVAVSRGWTGESLRVRFYEAIDRIGLRWMDRVVCVSESQAAKVRQTGVSAARTMVIPNAVRVERFAAPKLDARELLQSFFPTRRRLLVGAIGRLSPEKGFDVLVTAAADVVHRDPSVGFVVFGEGMMRPQLEAQIAARKLNAHMILAGFRDDIDRLLPSFDLLVLPSFSEGMPNAVLEAMAARLAVVATAVGGSPELVEEGVTGYLVPDGNPGALALRVSAALACDQERRAMGQRGHERVLKYFTFAGQSRRYQQLFDELLRNHKSQATIPKQITMTKIPNKIEAVV
jgi:glycosyltransferase involved in cell wall biosynthesis